MHLIAALYDQREAADEAVRQLRERLNLPADSIDIAAFGAYGSPDDGLPMLATHVPDAQLEDAQALIAATGGRVIDSRRQ